MAAHPGTSTLSSFKGINNILRPERTPVDYLKTATNTDIDTSGGIRKRLGYSLLESGNFHSVWADDHTALVVKDNSLHSVDSSLSTTDLGLAVNERLTYDSQDGSVYFTNINLNGRVVGNSVAPWGIVAPIIPALSATSGLMTAGTYRLTLTYITSEGLESGARLASTITLGDNSGISFNMPAPSESQVTALKIYVTTPDGEEFYLQSTISVGIPTLVITSVVSAVVPLQSFGYVPPPTGEIVKIAHGRAVVASGGTLWFSQPYAYHWFDLQKDFIQFDGEITAVMPVEGGIWVSADKLYYLRGRELEKMKQEFKEPVVAVRGTEVLIPGSYIFIENTPIGYKWLVTTDLGVFVCFNDGFIINVTEKNYVFPEASEGSGLFVQRDGINRYLTILNKSGDSQNTAVGDMVSATIIRNGKVLED